MYGITMIFFRIFSSSVVFFCCLLYAFEFLGNIFRHAYQIVWISGIRKMLEALAIEENAGECVSSQWITLHNKKKQYLQCAVTQGIVVTIL